MIAHLLRHELRLRLLTPTWWMLAAGTWLICAWLLFAQLQVYQEIQPRLSASGANLGINDLLIAPTLSALGVLLLGMVPLLGMSAIAGERRSGRLGAILATPVGPTRLLAGKWLGIFLPATLIVFGIFGMLASLAAGMRIDWARLAVALAGLVMLAGLATSITLACSAFSRQPAAAFAAALTLLLFLWLGDSFVQPGSTLYWFTLAPRLQHSLQGSLLSDDIAYFALLGLAALLLAGVGLLRDRESPPLRPLRELLALCLLGVALWAGATLSQAHRQTLFRAEPLPDALPTTVAAVQGPLTITAYAPDLPMLRARIEKLVRPVRERHGAVELRWVDPQREPQLARELGITGNGELRIEAMGRSQRVSELNHAGMLRALRHIARRGEPWVVALNGQGEAPIDDTPQGIGAWVRALGEYGYRVVGMDATRPIPDNAALLLVVAPQREYPPEVRTRLAAWLDRGGRLLWLHEGGAARTLQALTGVATLPGTLVSPVQRTGLGPLQLIATASPGTDALAQSGAVMDGPRALLDPPGDRWRIDLRLSGEQHAWNETGPLQGELQRNPLQGERTGPHRLGLLMRDADTRVAILGDSDLARNGLFGRSGNRQLLLGLVNRLTGNQLDTGTAANDTLVRWSTATGITLAILHLLLGPLLLAGLGLWIHRVRERA